MDTFSDYAGQTLELKQPKLLKDSYDLMYGEITLGNLKFPRAFSVNAEVEIFNTKWEIKKESFWKGILGIYKQRDELPYVKYVPLSIRRAEIQFYRGDYLSVRQYFFKSLIELMDKEDVILSVKSKSGFKKKYWIEIKQKHKLLDDNPWLLFLLCYIAIRKEKRAHSS